MEQTYFRRGFGLKDHIERALAADYHSRVVDRIRGHGYTLSLGDLTFRLAREFGFCYGVDRAVEYAYETRTKFPDKRIFLVGEIIHNPHVNLKLRAMGVTFLERPDGAELELSGVTPDDVIILPAFGVTVRDFDRLRARRHDLRLRAQRVEAGRVVRQGRLHGDHPRQVIPRGDEGHLEPGDQVHRGPLPRSTGHGAGTGRVRLHRVSGEQGAVSAELRRQGVARLRPGSRPRSGGGRESDDHAVGR